MSFQEMDNQFEIENSIVKPEIYNETTTKNNLLSYQSPIALEKYNYVGISQSIEIYGRNENAIFNKESKNFNVQRKIVCTINNNKYLLVEYHFHTPSEHKKYPAELHYVFVEYDENVEDNDINENNYVNEQIDICGCNYSHNKNILVIARTILNGGGHRDIKNIPVKVPHYYYQYDGNLNSDKYSPVSWIVGETPIHFDTNQLTTYSKPSRPLQDINGRIILFSEKR